MFRKQNEAVKWQYFLVGALLCGGGVWLYLEQQRREAEANNPVNPAPTGGGGTLTPSPGLLPQGCNCASGNKCGGCGSGGNGGVTIVTAGVGKINGTRYF